MQLCFRDRILLLAAGVLAVACAPQRDTLGRAVQSDSLLVRALLAGEIARRDSADTATLRFGPIRDEGLRLQHTSSNVVPRVQYVWASYCVPGAFPCIGDATVAVDRGDSTRLILGTADWAWAVGAWRPRAASDAISACEELVHVSRPNASFNSQPLVLSTRTGFEPREASGLHAFMDSSVWPLTRIDTLRLRKRPYLLQLPLSDENLARVRARRRNLHEPRAHIEADAWRVVLWAIREVELARYQCSFRQDQDANAGWVNLVKLDSTQLEGWPRL